MVYTIKIKDKSIKARSIINILKALQKDYDFIEITEEKEIQEDDDIMKELEIRYNYFIKNHKGKEWSALLNDF
jgi:hypothetical protein